MMIIIANGHYWEPLVPAMVSLQVVDDPCDGGKKKKKENEVHGMH